MKLRMGILVICSLMPNVVSVMKAEVMAAIFNMHGRREIQTKFLSRNFKGRGHV